ncbi:hypothetical protein EMIT0180MI3_11097 [Priestia megaterium]
MLFYIRKVSCTKETKYIDYGKNKKRSITQHIQNYYLRYRSSIYDSRIFIFSVYCRRRFNEPNAA